LFFLLASRTAFRSFFFDLHMWIFEPPFDRSRSRAFSLSSNVLFPFPQTGPLPSSLFFSIGPNFPGWAFLPSPLMGPPADICSLLFHVTFLGPLLHEDLSVPVFPLPTFLSQYKLSPLYLTGRFFSVSFWVSMVLDCYPSLIGAALLFPTLRVHAASPYLAPPPL